MFRCMYIFVRVRNFMNACMHMIPFTFVNFRDLGYPNVNVNIQIIYKLCSFFIHIREYINLRVH